APAGFGGDVGFGPGGITSAGYHVDGTIGAGASGVVTGTDHWCWFGCPDTPDNGGTPSDDELPNSNCEGADAGLCDPDPNNPDNGPADRQDNPGNVCETPSTCDQPPNSSSPDFPPSPGSGGDPHLTTADGVRFDLQRVGEFVALKADNADLTVQVR